MFGDAAAYPRYACGGCSVVYWTIVYLRWSMAPFISHFFVRRINKALNSSHSVLVVLLFVICSMLSYFFITIS